MTEEQKLKQDKNNVNLEEYKDLGGVSLKKLNRGLWFVEHRRQMRLIFIGFLIFISSISWIYSLYGFGYYFIKGMKDDEAITRSMLTSVAVGHDFINQISPRDIDIFAPKVLKADGKKYDFLVQIKNPNDRHWATFEYHFSTNNKELGRSKSFILPGESKYLVSLANEFDFSPTNVKIVFDSFNWGRVNRHEIPDWEEYRYDRLDIAVDKKEFLPAKVSGLSEKLNLNNLKFETTNKTAYSYWNIDFVILLWNNNAVVAVNKYSLPEFATLQTRTIEMSWPGILSRIDKIDVLPELNIMKKDIYMEYKAPAQR